jgi:hypothetical protein
MGIVSDSCVSHSGELCGLRGYACIRTILFPSFVTQRGTSRSRNLLNLLSERGNYYSIFSLHLSVFC